MAPKAFTMLSVQTKTIYQRLKHRYGPRYTHAMLSTTFFSFFVPVPGIALLAVAVIVTIAESHRAIRLARRTRERQLDTAAQL